MGRDGGDGGRAWLRGSQDFVDLLEPFDEVGFLGTVDVLEVAGNELTSVGKIVFVGWQR